MGCPKEHVKRKATEKNNRDEPVLNMTSNKKQKVAKFDRRKDNRGSASRARATSREKIIYVDEINAYLDRYENVTLNKYLLNVNKCHFGEVSKLSLRYYMWNKKKPYKEAIRDLLNLLKNDNGSKGIRNIILKSPFHDMETKLYASFKEMRAKGRKISSNWLMIQGKRIFQEMKRNNLNLWRNQDFKCSYGWMRLFIKSKNIKFRNSKCGKENCCRVCPRFFFV